MKNAGLQLVIETLDQSNSVPQAFFWLGDRLSKGTNLVQGTLNEQQSTLEPSARERTWQALPYSETSAAVLRVAHFLKGSGVAPGSKVAILANTRSEWLISDMAIMALGGISVSIFPTLPPSEIGFILADCGANVIIAENQEQVDKLLSLNGTHYPFPAIEDSPAIDKPIHIERIVSIEECGSHPLVTSWSTIQSVALEAAKLSVKSDIDSLERSDIATIVYTSGTSGPMKGVLQTHGNHLANVRQVLESGILRTDSRIVLVLPLAHSFARLIGYVGMLTTAEVVLPAVTSHISSALDQRSITRDLRDSSAEIIPVVPRLLERMQTVIVQQSQKSKLGSRLLKLCLNTEQANSPLLHWLLAPIRRSISKKLFGSRFKFCISGGAKLAVSTSEFFKKLDILILEGYGLTETAVATNLNRPDNNKIGTVGPVLAADIEVRIAEDGEIMFRGPNIAVGYFNRPQATAEVWDQEGWFKTGDLGSLDSEGFLSITGRKKEIIVLSTGKKVAPVLIENLLARSHAVSQSVICGDGRPYCVALMVPTQKETEHKTAVDELSSEIDAAVKAANADLPHYAEIKKFAVIDEPFSIENGLMTPTFKIKRREVEKRYAYLLEDLYTAKKEQS